MPTASVTSVRSDRVTSVRHLHDRGGRRKSGLFLVEGPQAVAAAFAAGVGVHEVFVDVSAGGVAASLAEQSPVMVTWVTPQVLAAMGETKASQGILVTCAIPASSDIATLMALAGPVVVLDSVGDPGNVGTIIRTADAVGAAGVVLADGCADPFNGKVVRSTAGSIFHLPLAYGVAMSDVISSAKQAGRQILGLAGEGAQDLFALPTDPLGQACWIVGSEAHGIGESARAGADALVRIPMRGLAESLNAAVAASVALYISAERTSG